MSNNRANFRRGWVPGIPPKSFEGCESACTCTPDKNQPTTNQNANRGCVQCGPEKNITECRDCGKEVARDSALVTEDNCVVCGDCFQGDKCGHCEKTKLMSEMYSPDGDTFYCDTTCYYLDTGIAVCNNCYEVLTEYVDCYKKRIPCEKCGEPTPRLNLPKGLPNLCFSCNLKTLSRGHPKLKKLVSDSENADSFLMNCAWFAIGVVVKIKGVFGE